jgi:hypothetical protein
MHGGPELTDGVGFRGNVHLDTSLELSIGVW